MGEFEGKRVTALLLSIVLNKNNNNNCLIEEILPSIIFR